MQKRGTSILIIMIGLSMIALALAGLYLGDGTLFESNAFSITTPDGDQLNGTYYPGSQSVAVLLAEDLGDDQVSMRSLANEFNSAGFNVFTFDFSGQGSSSGSLTFDYTQTDRLASQLLLVEKNITSISGQDNLPLIVVGHGLGGRVALQSAVIDPRSIQGLILIGPQLNLSTYQPAEFFTETQDNSLAWVHLLNRTIPNTKLLILSSSQDDIFTQDAGTLLLQVLTDDRSALPGPVITPVNLTDASRQWLLFPDQSHNFEIDDSQIIDAALAWSQQILKVNPVLPVSPVADTRGWLWLFGITGIAVACEGTRRAVLHRIHYHTPDLHGLEIINLRRFFLSKVILWLAAVPVMALLVGFMLLIPLPKPIYNFYYVGILGGYGLLRLILYIIGWLPGAHGKIKLSLSQKKIAWHRVINTLEFNLAILTILALYTNSGWYAAPPGGLRLVWVLILTPFTALGFWIGQLDIDLIAHNDPKTRIAPALVMVNSLLPFVLYIIVMAVIKSSSGVVLGLQGMVVLLVVQVQGIITYRLTGIRWLTALLQALILFLFVLPTGALFSL